MAGFIFLYLLFFIALWWGYFGYIIFLYIFSTINPPKNRLEELEHYPSLTLLIPCFNETDIIEEKVQNLADLSYPKEKLEIVFLDGASTDGTFEKIKAAIEPFPYMNVVQTNCRGKINQINYYLPEVTSDIVINNDVDTRISPDALIQLAREFQSDSKVGIVGGLSIPVGCLVEESQYWKNQNQIRVLESWAYSSSIVIAVFYGFRRELIDKFPEDVVADDIFLPFQANVKGYKAIYSPKIIAFELRAAKSRIDFIRHKFRKTNAYITEILRFLYHLPKLNLFWKVIFITRAFQLLGTPWLLVIFLVMSLSFIRLFQWELVLWCGLIAALSLAICHKMIATIELPETPKKDRLFLSLRIFLLINFILICAGLTYPFYIQDSSYEKIN